MERRRRRGAIVHMSLVLRSLKGYGARTYDTISFDRRLVYSARKENLRRPAFLPARHILCIFQQLNTHVRLKKEMLFSHFFFFFSKQMDSSSNIGSIILERQLFFAKYFWIFRISDSSYYILHLKFHVKICPLFKNTYHI